MDPGFRRVNKVDRIQQLEGHIQELRDLMEKQNETILSSPRSNLSITVAEALTSEIPDSGLRGGPATDVLENQGPVQEPLRHPSHNKYTIGPVTLSQEQADTLVAL